MNASRLFSQRIFLVALILVVLMLKYQLLRAGFYFFNIDFYTDVETGAVLSSFVNGMRFDLAAILLLNSPVLILYLFPGPQVRYRWFRLAVFIMFFILNLVALLLNVAEYGYFSTVQRRLMFEPYTMLPDLVRSLPGLIAGHILLTLLFLALTILLYLSLKKLITWSESRFPFQHRWLKDSVWFVLSIMLMVIGIRGGLQLKPLRQSNAFTTSHVASGYLTLNTTYTVIRSYFQPALEEYRFMQEDEALNITRSLLFTAKESIIDPQFPFYRKLTHTEPAEFRNVVIFIMENWTAGYVGCLGGKEPNTPFFDSLSAEGMLFTNFLANGQRSIEAVPSILTSIPGLYPSSLIGSKAEMNRMAGLGELLQRHGYSTSFHHGASVGSMGFDAYARIAGFYQYFGMEDFPNVTADETNGSWGVHDEPFFLDALRRIERMPRPFCSVIFSISSHDPYDIPSYRQKQFEQIPFGFNRSLQYSDFSIGQLIREAKSKPWFDSTVFIITADHTLYSARGNMHAAFHIPTLIYAPGLVAKQRFERVASHVDLMPTLIDLLKIPVSHASFGSSLLSDSSERFAVVRFGPHFGLFSDSLVLIHDTEKIVGLFEYRSDPLHKRNLMQERSDVARRMERKLLAYVQTASHAVAQDRIHPR